MFWQPWSEKKVNLIFFRHRVASCLGLYTNLYFLNGELKLRSRYLVGFQNLVYAKGFNYEFLYMYVFKDIC